MYINMDTQTIRYFCKEVVCCYPELVDAYHNKRLDIDVFYPYLDKLLGRQITSEEVEQFLRPFLITGYALD